MKDELLFGLCMKNIYTINKMFCLCKCSVIFPVPCSVSNIQFTNRWSKIGMAAYASSEGEINKNEDRCLLFPPTEVRGMKVLDREKFSKTIIVPWLTINEMSGGHIMNYLRKYHKLGKYLLKLNGFNPVQALEPSSQDCTSTVTKIALNPTMVKCYEDIKEDDRRMLQNFKVSRDSLKFEKLIVTYDNWRKEDLLKAILPENKDGLSRYSVMGHIVHVNIREHLLDYKHVIGQILLDKVHHARTVVNKTNNIDNTYRIFKMEILCGEDCMMTQVKENHCTYEFDFSSVYWNSRLCMEHIRIVEKVMQGDVLYDVFAGVGPFSVPAAMKKCIVLANDLNPESHKWLEHNSKLNKVDKLLQTFNKDGKAFIQQDMKSDMLQRWQNSNFKNSTMHITMNLPSMAVTFLKVFRALFTPEELESIDIKKFPVVYVYCFAKGDNPVTIAKEMVEENLGVELKEDLMEIFQVRNVAKKKEMMCVTFQLSKSILTTNHNIHHKSSRKCVQDLLEEPQLKRLCVGDNGEDNEKKEQAGLNKI